MTTTRSHNSFRQLLFGVQRSVRYHSRRVKFYDGIHQLTTFCTLLFGSATVAMFSDAIVSDLPLWVKLLPSLLVSILAAASISLGVVQKARLHERLMRDFIALERSLKMKESSRSAKFLENAVTSRLEIEVDEPPVLRVLDTICHNELLRAMGYCESKQIKVGFWQRCCAHFFDLREHTLQRTG